MNSYQTFPVINATLNSLSAVLILSGIMLIRRGARSAHKRAMIAAFSSSTLFLLSYLYYHLIVMQGHPVYYQGHGWSRAVYFSILLTHTILAAVIVPFVIVTVVRGLNGRFEKHRAIARYTYPVWLYVSVTGVVIYFMLYQW